jgi:transcriptional regulator with XRE-family HTH domain
VEDTSATAIAAVLDQVGARLTRIRTQRGITLTGVAEATGISKSTLSRLETGQRRPTLELLLALSHTDRVPLDDLVGAPPEGDPRLQRCRPRGVQRGQHRLIRRTDLVRI